jgi:hypothetical protein
VGLRSLDDPLPRTKQPGHLPELQPAWLSGNRDYVILVECRGTAAVIYPQKIWIAADSLTAGQAGAAQLRETIQQMIARRQASVRKGEQPYRPQVRFLVRPDGLRTMYLAYPAVDQLRVPLTRQNLDANDEVLPGSP